MPILTPDLINEISECAQLGDSEHDLMKQLTDLLRTPFNTSSCREALALIYKQTFQSRGFLDAARTTIQINKALILRNRPLLKDFGPFNYKKRIQLHSLLQKLSQKITDELPTMMLDEFNQLLEKESTPDNTFFEEFEARNKSEPQKSSKEIIVLQEELRQIENEIKLRERENESHGEVNFLDIISTVKTKGFSSAKESITLSCLELGHSALQKATHIAKELLQTKTHVGLGINLLNAALYNGHDFAATTLIDFYDRKSGDIKKRDTALIAYQMFPDNRIKWFGYGYNFESETDDQKLYRFWKVSGMWAHISAFHVENGAIEKSILYYYLAEHGIPESKKLDKNELLELLKSTLECVESGCPVDSGYRVGRILPNYVRALEIIEIFQCLDPSYKDLSAYDSPRVLPSYAANLEQANTLMNALSEKNGLTEEHISTLEDLYSGCTPLENIVEELQKWLSQCQQKPHP